MNGSQVMATTKKSNRESKQKSPNWSHFKDERVLILWQVVALSLGVEPVKTSIEQACEDQAFKDQYIRRRRTLSRMLSVEQLEDHVTYFPDHEYNKGKPQAYNRMVDVVSCIKKLQKLEHERLPKEFVDLLNPLERVFLPVRKFENVGLTLSPNITIVSAPGKAESSSEDGAAIELKKGKKDQSQAIERKEREQLSAMLCAVVLDSYGHDLSTPTGMNDAITAVEAAFERFGLKGRYGHSRAKIKTVLKEGFGFCKLEEPNK
jgi:hypothetical protein